MFDPFQDFEEHGYLRNTMREKDPDLVRHAEHGVFLANYPEAIYVLSRARKITYGHFLQVHEILFKDFYPWAGKDRRVTAPDSAIKKGDTRFCHPAMCQRAVEHALELVHKRGVMLSGPGHIMGLFAYGHPFLDGNGRTMLLVHGELCFRAGMSIQWEKTNKSRYLKALAQEIAEPHDGHLDAYLKPFIGPKVPREKWQQVIGELPGLDGADLVETEVDGKFSDASVAAKYDEFEKKRDYELAPDVCQECNVSPCVCDTSEVEVHRRLRPN